MKMIRNCLRLLPMNISLLFPTSIVKFNSLSKLRRPPHCSHLEHRYLINSHVLFSQETLVPEKNETESNLISAVTKNLEDYGFTNEDIEKLFESQPRLVNSSVNSWVELVECLYTLCFAKEEVVHVLEVWPEILRLDKSLLSKNFATWANTGIGQELLFTVLKTHPMLLSLDSQLVSKRVKQYQLYFESKNRVGKLLLLAPNVFDEKWRSIRDKLNYLDELCTDKSDLVSTGVLRHSLFHIRSRHEFLVRAGLYKIPKKDFNKKLSKNPSLDSIVNTTDEDFILKVARLSMFEFEVFLNLFNEEMSEQDDDLDSDDETAHKENYNLHYKKDYKR